MGDFGDGLKMGDAVQVQLECGHPHVKPGERCPKCGKILEEADASGKTG